MTAEGTLNGNLSGDIKISQVSLNRERINKSYPSWHYNDP